MNLQNLLNALPVVGIGIACVFAVTGINILVVTILNKFGNE